MTARAGFIVIGYVSDDGSGDRESLPYSSSHTAWAVTPAEAEAMIALCHERYGQPEGEELLSPEAFTARLAATWRWPGIELRPGGQ